MPARDVPYPSEWLQKAEEDFRRVTIRLDEGDAEDAAFHLQQALEKALKAFLLSRGWSLKKIHDLEALLDDAVRYDASLECFRALAQEVTGYYLLERYPSFEAGPSSEDLRRASRESERLMALVRRAIPSKR